MRITARDMTLLDVHAIAALLQMNHAHVRDRVTRQRGFPPPYRIGNSLRWDSDEVAHWLESRRVSPVARRVRRREAA
jgi:predicted DNA-binding transcriptional regulator AlpA